MLKNYKNYRNTLNRTIKAAKENYCTTKKGLQKTKSFDLWKIMNNISSFKSKKKLIARELDTVYGVSRDQQVICEELNTFLSTSEKTWPIKLSHL